MRRVIKTTKVLAVTMVAAACQSAGQPTPRDSSSAVAASENSDQPASQGGPATDTSADESDVSSGSGKTTPAAAPAPAPEASPALHTLSAELEQVGRQGALANLKRFRPLCDERGFPLVGNMVRKGPPAEYRVSTFCSDVRKHGSL
jgi:hypothetical protein